MQPHQAFHFVNGRCRGIGLQKGVVALAVLVDLVGHRLDAPVFLVRDGAPIVGEDGTEMVHQTFGLRVGQILTRNENMLVKRHSIPFLFEWASKTRLSRASGHEGHHH